MQTPRFPQRPLNMTCTAYGLTALMTLAVACSGRNTRISQVQSVDSRNCPVLRDGYDAGQKELEDEVRTCYRETWDRLLGSLNPGNFLLETVGEETPIILDGIADTAPRMSIPASDQLALKREALLKDYELLLMNEPEEYAVQGVKSTVPRIPSLMALFQYDFNRPAAVIKLETFIAAERARFTQVPSEAATEQTFVQLVKRLGLLAPPLVKIYYDHFYAGGCKPFTRYFVPLLRTAGYPAYALTNLNHGIIGYGLNGRNYFIDTTIRQFSDRNLISIVTQDLVQADTLQPEDRWRQGFEFPGYNMFFIYQTKFATPQGPLDLHDPRTGIRHIMPADIPLETGLWPYVKLYDRVPIEILTSSYIASPDEGLKMDIQEFLKRAQVFETEAGGTDALNALFEAQISRPVCPPDDLACGGL